MGTIYQVFNDIKYQKIFKKFERDRYGHYL